MNLIERLGGYKNSKGIREAYVSNGWSVSDVCKGFHEYFTIEDLDCALLEYRRQHNIFEVKDKVVFTDKYSNSILLTITELTCSYAFTSMEFGEISFDSVRHATDAEIKAGRRL